MIAIFSGHTEYEVGNVLGDVSEHSVAMKIIADVGTCARISYNKDTCQSRYDIVGALNETTKAKLGIIMHFPLSYNTAMNRSVIVYNDADYESYAYASLLQEVCLSYNLNTEVLSCSECNHVSRFVMRKAKVPVIVFEPFFLSHVGHNIGGESQRCVLALKKLKRMLKE
jgi:hypothetical protein